MKRWPDPKPFVLSAAGMFGLMLVLLVCERHGVGRLHVRPVLILAGYWTALGVIGYVVTAAVGAILRRPDAQANDYDDEPG